MRIPLALLVTGFTTALIAACGSSANTVTAAAPTDPVAAESDDAPDAGQADGALGSPDATRVNPPLPPATGEPGCQGTTYTEALPTSASLDDLRYSQATAETYFLTALERRYPIGKYLVQGGISSPIAAQQGNCFDRFTRDKSTASRVLQQGPTSVHECGHIFNLGDASGGASVYHVRPDLTFTCSRGDTTSRRGKTFARSRINDDAYYAKRPACNGARTGCDTYADVYLTGDPDDATFQGGDQGYNSVLEEATQYVNSLATALAFEDSFQRGTRVSERDGILTFLWYIERYVKMARESYPEAYSTLSADPCWRQATLTVWDRAWFFLNATKDKRTLGIDDAAIESLVRDATLTKEIDALRALECTP